MFKTPAATNCLQEKSKFRIQAVEPCPPKPPARPVGVWQMLTPSELSSGYAYRQLPQIPRSELQLLWHADYWDGPRSGLVLYRGERCWFEVVAENDDEDEPYVCWRLFAVLRLTPDPLAEEERWHALFREKVGTHTDYDASGVRHVGQLRPQKEGWDFYAAWAARTPMNPDDNEVLGWFDERRGQPGEVNRSWWRTHR
jgi:hypothetical protein